MRWLPEYGVGIIAFGNRTYTGWGTPIDSAFIALAETGALTPRMPVPAPALVDARAKVTRLVLNWDDKLAQSIAADNLFLDLSIDRRAAQIAALKSGGDLHAGSGFDYVERAPRAWVRPVAREPAGLDHLAPTEPPTVSSSKWVGTNDECPCRRCSAS
jgi:hypothetical protein